MEGSTAEKLDGFSEGLDHILNSGGEDTCAHERLPDPGHPAQNGKLRDARPMREFTVTEKVSEMPDNAGKASGGVSKEEGFLNLALLDDTGGKNGIKPQKDILDSPETEILEKHEHFYSRPAGSEEQTNDKGSRLGVLCVAEGTFGLDSQKASVKSHITNVGFSEQLLGAWEQGVHSGFPVVPSEEDSKGDASSICSFSQDGQAADQAKKRASDNDYVSEKGQCAEQLAFPVKRDGETVSEQESVVSEEDFSWGLDGKIEGTDKRNCREETYSESESVSKSSSRQRESTKANVTAESCRVVWEDIHHEKKDKHSYCLKPQDVKKLPPKPQNDNNAILKKLRVALYDLLDKSATKNPRKPLQIKNAERPLENENMDEVERDLELNSPARVPQSGQPVAAGTNIGHDPEKSGGRTSSPDISTLCERGVFARFSFMDSEYENSVVGLCHVPEEEKVTESRPGDSIQVSETPRLKTASLKPTETILGCGNKLVKEVPREDSGHKAEACQETSGKAVIEDVGQPRGVNLSSVSHGKALHTYKMDSAETSFNEAKFSNVPVKRMSDSPLPDKTGHEDVLQGSGEFESRAVSSCLGDSLKLKPKGTIPSGSKIKTPTDRRIALDYRALDEEVNEDQLNVEKQEVGSQSDSIARNRGADTCSFWLELDEVIEECVPAYATEEENNPECGTVRLGHGIDGPESEGKSTCQSLAEYMAIIKPGAISKRIMAEQEGSDGEINDAEENVNPQPAKKTSPVGDKGLQPRQSRGIQNVFYELSGSVVRLLGTPRGNRDTFRLGKLVELENSSSDEESQDSVGSLSPGSKNEGKTYSANKPLKLDDSNSKTRRRRPNISAAPTRRSQLSQDQSRTKVVDALRETLQKRLDASPDLNVPGNTVSKIAQQVEREVFKLSCCVDQHYRNKYRSLLFNLKSPENQPLFHRVVLGEIPPRRLVQMTSLEMAPKELAEWRAKESKRVLEIIQKEEQEARPCCSAKFTHKGIIEIHRESEEDWTAQEICGSQSLEGKSSSESLTELESDPGENANGFKCPGQMTADNAMGFERPTNKRALNWKSNASSSLYPEGRGKSLQQEGPASPGIPKKRRVEERSTASAVWKGLIHMFSIKQFWAKAYPVSGSGSHLCQCFPHLLRSRGCIVPEDVWTYLDSIWPANSKEMGVIRFRPSLAEGSSPYDTLFSYLNNKQKYGVVDSNQVEIFMVPLAACQPVPSRFHPLGGPGLEPSHPSLLLGLILPKRTCRGPLEAEACPLPNTKRKAVTFSGSTETRCLAHSSLPRGATGLSRPPEPLSTGGLICGEESPAESVTPEQDPLTLNALLGLAEELGRQLLPSDPSSLPPEAYPVTLAEPLQSLSNLPWAGDQLGRLTLEVVEVQPCPDGDQLQLCIHSDPPQFWNALGLPWLPEALGPNPHGTSGAQATSISVGPFGPRTLSAEPAPACETPPAPPSPQILCGGSVAGESSSLVEETWSLLRHVDQLQSCIQSQEPPPPPAAASSLPLLPPEMASALSQAVAGLEFPSVQDEDGTYAHLQQLLSALSGQTQPPSAL